MIIGASKAARAAPAHSFKIELMLVRTLFAVAFAALSLVGCSSREQAIPDHMSVGAQNIQTSSLDTYTPPQITVQTGDTLHALARRHKLSVYGFQLANNLQGPQIYPGQKLFLPTH